MKVSQVFGRIKFIRPRAWTDAVAALRAGRFATAGIGNDDFEIIQFETVSLDGYKLPANFPNCCGPHKNIYQSALDRFNEFPNCCEHHSRLVNEPWFDKLDYTYLPTKLITTIDYTLDCIDRCIDNKEWYKEITDYIAYTAVSFGQFPSGYGGPLGLHDYLKYVRGNLEIRDQIPEDKRRRIDTFIDTYYQVERKDKEYDLEILVAIYREWLAMFPFEISYLSHLKAHYEGRVPILKGAVEVNMYTGVASSKMIKKRELFEFLRESTLQIITAINALKLHHKGILTDRDETELQLLTAKRKLELGALGLSKSDDRQGYVKLLGKWLKGERNFVRDLRKLLREGRLDDRGIAMNILDGFRLLQSNDKNENCIMNVRNNGTEKESQIRYWFKNFLSARYRDAVLSTEEEKGAGKIDLTLSHAKMGKKVIEFKGWWNQGKKETPAQIVSYLTDFEYSGFIVMVNHLKKKDIARDYRELVCDPSAHFEEGSLKVHSYPNSEVEYFETRHKFGIQTKTLYHFILNAHF